MSPIEQGNARISIRPGVGKRKEAIRGHLNHIWSLRDVLQSSATLAEEHGFLAELVALDRELERASLDLHLSALGPDLVAELGDLVADEALALGDSLDGPREVGQRIGELLRTRIARSVRDVLQPADGELGLHLRIHDSSPSSGQGTAMPDDASVKEGPRPRGGKQQGTRAPSVCPCCGQAVQS